MCYFFFLYRSPSSLCTAFDSISSNIDEVLLINPSANDFNVHYKNWLIDRPGELCYNFSISNDLTQMFNFLTRIPDCDSLISALLVLFISSDAIICSTMVFPPLGNSDHVVVSVSIDFPTNSKQDVPFHRIAYDYSCADWGGHHDHLRDVPWENIFKLSASAAGSEFCKWVRMYQVKPHSSPWLSAACAAAIVTFGELLIVFSTKVNLLYLLYSTARRCCLLHLIKQNCLLKTFVITLILMTRVSLCLFSLLGII